MSLDLIITSKPKEVVIALLKDKSLIEVHTEKLEDNTISAGDIFLGKVKRTHPGLNAAFVNVGYEKDAFLHYSDLGASYKSIEKVTKQALNGNLPNDINILPEIEKYGKIKDQISANQKILVQITKEPISSKGPKVTTEITLPGRYLVLIPFTNKISVSQKIEDPEEKNRLVRLIESIKPKNFGVIIRTVAQTRKVAELNEDLQEIKEKWDSIYANIHDVKPPKKILGELNKASAIVRDILNEDFNSIIVDDPILHLQLKEYIERISPDKSKIVKLHKGKADVFQEYGIHKQIKASFGRKVPINNGGYLIIDHAEAMHVIDVNSGNRSNKALSQEETALEVNLIAASEIARQLQLRDMGGIIVVDFIDLRKAESRKELLNKMKEFMKLDKAKHHILPPSKFGLVQITRQRVRPEMEIKTSETIPKACKTRLAF